jgi:hypothetical protein
MKAKILYQESYVSRLYLNIDFEYDNMRYTAKCTYINGCVFEDIEILEYSTYKKLSDDNPIVNIGKELLENMDIEKHVKF